MGRKSHSGQTPEGEQRDPEARTPKVVNYIRYSFCCTSRDVTELKGPFPWFGRLNEYEPLRPITAVNHDIGERYKAPSQYTLCRPAALEARRQSLPHYGVTSEPKLFGLWTTFPWQLRKHSAFLALHFGSIGLFVFLLLGYSALAVWPLQDTLKANNYRSQYIVIDPTNQTICEPRDKPYPVLLPSLRICREPDIVESSALLSITLNMGPQPRTY